MIGRTLAALVGLVLAVAVGWWVHQVMPVQGWAHATAEGWQLVASGWGLWRYAWPVALAGALAGALAAWWGLLGLAGRAAEADYQGRRQRLARQAAELQQQAQALKRERAGVVERRQALYAAHDQRLAEVEQREQAAARQVAEAQRLARQAQDERAEAFNHLLDAERRRRNAAATAERRRRQLQRLTITGSATEKL
jgi:hypothetical protein